MNPFTGDDSIRIATPNDLSWIIHLQDLHRHELGRLHRSALADKIDRGKIILLVENGQPAGYLNFTHRRDHHVHLLQIAITEELWRSGHGSRAMTYLTQQTLKRGALWMTCRTAKHLPANQFWPSLGFKQYATIRGPRRTLNKWAKRLSPIIIPAVRLHFPPLRRKHPRPRATAHQTDTLTLGTIHSLPTPPPNR